MFSVWVGRARFATRLALALSAGLAVGSTTGCSRPDGASSSAAAQAPNVVTVPFVGCPQDGSYGASPAPTGAVKVVQLDAITASKLAFYSDISHGILAPRGWSCFGFAGPGATTLYVAPPPVGQSDVIDGNWRGPVVELFETGNDSQGRFDVARFITRLFPAHQAYAQSVINEGVEPASDFPTGVPATDKVNRLSDELVEYETPPNTDGLGVAMRLQPGEDPLDGFVLLRGQTPAVVFAAVRLGPEMRDLAPTLVGQVERDSGMDRRSPGNVPVALSH